MVAVIVLAALALLLFVFVASGVRIVRPFQRGIVERLGRYKETVDPGLRIIIPLIEHLRLVDMREQVVDVPPQEVITKDNVVVSVDAVVYYEPTDAQRLVYNVANFMLAVTKLAQTNLRNLVGDLQLDEALTSARPDQQPPPPDPRRRDRQLGRAGQAGRAAAHRSAARRHALHARADEGRAHTPCGRAHRVGRAGGRHRTRPGPEGVGDPRGRGRPAAPDPRGGGPGGRDQGGGRRRALPADDGRGGPGAGDRERVPRASTRATRHPICSRSSTSRRCRRSRTAARRRSTCRPTRAA